MSEPANMHVCEACKTTDGRIEQRPTGEWRHVDNMVCIERMAAELGKRGPDKPNVCEACGSTEAPFVLLDGVPRCFDVYACRERAMASLVMRELRATDPDFGKETDIHVHVCEACGATYGLYLSHHAGWLCNDVAACLERIAEPDYAALGYPETEITEAVCGFEELAMGIDLYMGTMFGDAWERAQAMEDRRKDIRGATDNG